MGPIICMVTTEDASPGTLVPLVAEAAAAGVHVLQIRQPAAEGRALFELTVACVNAVRGTRTRIVVNDRLDVALAAGAHGVHLRGTSLPARRIRQGSPPGFLVGRSVHSAAAAAAVSEEGGLDYLVFGTVFPTSSKPGTTPAGVATLREVVRATAVPVLAIGGVTPQRLEEVARAGAAGFAAIRLFDADPAALAGIVARCRAAFVRETT